ncbi:naringenin 3-dioxygenase [Diplodia corticola]|uniref:Naringenin 3-dioxygenase n=1 Tax=Diplodia corticola TaxID=236234 RepID=A0A1J9S871_9PEZI|nr:naringenin 3-dioxygenase [Diplodia corticola]OJD35781.1 naringenin 3-dioxygenase [Diplodia corticola]
MTPLVATAETQADEASEAPPSPSPSSFTAIPTLALRDARSPATKPRFLAALRAALLDVGFLYLDVTTGEDEGEGEDEDEAVATGLPARLLADAVSEGVAFFAALPDAEKRRIEMKNEKSFLGWSRLDNETTAMHADHREQLDLSTPHDLPGPDAPLYYNMRAPNQWPSPQYLPRFRPVFEEYMRAMSGISTFFTSLIAEAIGLPADAFDRFFDADQQHKLKVVKYPEASPDVDDNDEIARQGVGPHKDSMLTSYLLQASPQRGLQALNAAGEWIDCPPKPNTLVVVIGQGLEAITQGVCASTTHRVLSPRCGEGPRFSIPFFQGVSYDARFEEMDVPEAVRALKRERRDDKVDFAFVKGRWGHLGEATLVNRVRSHPDVGEKWYPEILAKIRRQQTEKDVAGRDVHKSS